MVACLLSYAFLARPVDVVGEANKMSYTSGGHYHIQCIRPAATTDQNVKLTGNAGTPKKRLGRKVIVIPPLAAPPSNSLSPQPQERDVGAGDGEDLFKDPAKLVLVKAEEAQRNRKQAETRIALEKIHDRIQCTLNDFEAGPFSEDKKLGKSEVNLEVVEDPAQLYDLLSDSRFRSKYQQNLTVFIVGYEEKCEERERVLGSLQEFFEETQSGGTQLLLDQLESEEIDFDEVTSGLESAMDTAQNAAEKLLKIKKDMSQLIAIVAAFPDTKKGRKKMEKALLKAQEEVEELSGSLEEVKGELEQSQEKCGQLQKQLEVKSQECSKLRPLADKAKLLQVSNESAKKEVENLQKALEKKEEELMETKKFVPTPSETFAQAAAIAVDQGKINELENQLTQEREKYDSLLAEKEELTNEHQAKMESMRAEHEAEIQEMRGRYEEQMKSLMEDDLFDEEDGELEEEGEEREEREMADESFLRDIGDEDTTTVSAEQDVMVPPDGVESLRNAGDESHATKDEADDEEIKGATPQEQDEATPISALMDTDEYVTDADVSIGKVADDSVTQHGGNDEQGSPPNQEQLPHHTAEATLPGMPPQKPHPPSPPTSTGSGSPAASVASSVKQGRRMSKAIVGKIQKEFESREKKLKHDLDEVKAKSRKAITSLKAQLADAHGRHTNEMEAMKKELDDIRVKLETIQSENSMLLGQVEMFKQENDELVLSLREKEEEVERLNTLADNLPPIDDFQGQRSDFKDPTVMMMMGRQGDISAHRGSPQYSEQSEQLTPRSVGAAPVLKMDEVFHSGDGLSLASGSVDLAVPDIRGAQFFGSPLNQSMNGAGDHAPLGSPLQSASLASDGCDGGSVRSGGGVAVGRAPSVPLQYGLGMLAQSRLSHHSPGPQGHLGFDHPVVMEWSKAYDTVIKFKDNLVDLLSESPGPLAAMADDLRTLELHRLDRSGDVQGQITEMRFSLALMLHQIEQTLQDTFAETLGITDSEEADSPKTATLAADSSDVEDFKVTVARLKSKLQDREQAHRIEMQESKETIANLSSKVENLKMEMVKLRQSLPRHLGRGGEGVGIEGGASIMFTRLDAERNRKTLQGALEKEWISPSLFHNVTSNMEDYLSIPGRRLAVLADQCRHKELTSSLLQHITADTQLLQSEKGSKVILEIRERDRVKQLQFALEMDRLTARRTSLANDLTHTLTHIEKKAGVFLIKPIYARSGTHGAGSLITPINRPLPVQPHPPSRSSAASQSRPWTRQESGRSTPHPSMKLVSQLVRARHQQTAGRGWNAKDLSGSGSPPSRKRQLPSLHTPTMPTGEWCGGESRIPPPAGGQDFVNPLSADVTQGPLMPRIMEMDILRRTQPDTLLGHLLPELLSRPASKAPPYKLDQLDNISATTPTGKISPDKSFEVNQIKANVHFDQYSSKGSRGHTHLPPIRVPSRIDHDRPLPVH